MGGDEREPLDAIEAQRARDEAWLARHRAAQERESACIDACDGIENPAAIPEVIAAARELLSADRASINEDLLDLHEALEKLGIKASVSNGGK